MKIVVDAFGGDYAPQEIVAGAVKALQENEKLKVVLVGDKDKMRKLLSDGNEKKLLSEKMRRSKVSDDKQ